MVHDGSSERLTAQAATLSAEAQGSHGTSMSIAPSVRIEGKVFARRSILIPGCETSRENHSIDAACRNRGSNQPRRRNGLRTPPRAMVLHARFPASLLLRLRRVAFAAEAPGAKPTVDRSAPRSPVLDRIDPLKRLHSARNEPRQHMQLRRLVRALAGKGRHPQSR